MVDTFTALDPDTLPEFEVVSITPDSVEFGPDTSRKKRVADAFDSGAHLRLDVPDADEQPGEGEARRRRRRGPNRPKAAGGEAMGALAVAGFSILITFVVGQWATPTEEEANALALPIGNILARRIDLASKLGRDTDDTLALLVALGSYGARIIPEAVNRSREAYDRQRARRATTDAPPRPLRTSTPRDGGGTGSVFDGAATGQGTPYSQTGTPLDVIASVGERQLRGLGIHTDPNP